MASFHKRAHHFLRRKESFHNLQEYFPVAFAFSFKDSFYYHKDKVLISDLASDIHIHQQQKTLVLTEPCSLTGRFEEEGTRAFIDHNLIPPFSSQTVSLDIKRAHISNLSLKTLSLRGSLNLYTLQCSKNNLLTVILCMLKQKPQENIPVNCGTIPFSAENGVLVYGKTPFLLDNTFEVISKGTVNLISDSLNILVGFTTDSLTKAFDLTNLPDGYIVPFSIRGSIHNPKFDTAQAIKNIAIILLLEKVAPEHRRYPKTQSF